MALTGNLPKVQTTSAAMTVFGGLSRGGLRFGHRCGCGPRVTGQRLCLHPPVNPVDTVDTAGSAETSPNFARNSPEHVLDHTLKTAEYQRFDFKV